MKILRLAVSHDAREDLPLEERQHVIAERMLEEATGLEWETVSRGMRPTETLPAMVEKWVEQERPDLVLVFMAGYWASFGSTALRIERRVPFVGKRAARVARSVAENETAARHATLDRLRGFASAVIGVDFNYEPEYLVGVFENVFRTLLRNEHLVIAVRGPGRPLQRLPRRQERESKARAKRFGDGIEELCGRLHITHLRSGVLPMDIRIPGDPVHFTVEGSRVLGREQGELMIRAWRQAQGEAAG